MKNIVLIGFMGTGKTSVGRMLAERLGLTFVDIDDVIEAENNMTIADMFAKFGEAYFREKEREVIQKVACGENMVIATGGGVVLFPDNMKRLRENGIVVSLFASVETILARTGQSNARPLLNRADREQAVSVLLAKRYELYKQADLCINTDNFTLKQTVEEIVAFVRGRAVL